MLGLVAPASHSIPSWLIAWIGILALPSTGGVTLVKLHVLSFLICQMGITTVHLLPRTVMGVE